MSDKAKELPPPSLGRTLINLLPLIILTWYLCYNRPDKDPNYQLDLCGQNLHKIGVALEKDRLLSEDKLYAKDIEAVFTSDAGVPACPNGGKDSYIKGYQVTEDRSGYLLVCKGDNHTKAGVPADYPRIAFSVQEATTVEKTGDNPQSSPTPASTPTSPTPRESPQPEATLAPAEAPRSEVAPTPATTPTP